MMGESVCDVGGIGGALDDLNHVAGPDDQVILYFGGYGHFEHDAATGWRSMRSPGALRSAACCRCP
jgi:hypothetical protein